MTPPYLTPRLHRLADPGPPGPPGLATPSLVALEVRLGTGRPVRYELEGAEFTVGAAADCDVRLPGADTPARVCSVARTANALFARRLDPAFPVLWNDRFLALDTPTRLGHGDRVAVGPLDVTVHLAGVYLHPDLGTPGPAPHAGVRPPRPDPHAPTPRPEPPPTYGPDATAQLEQVAQAREQLRRDRDDLAAQARELEQDRVLWYRRRQEMEAEGARTPAADPGHAADLSAREAELERFRDELTKLRAQLVDQYQERREQLSRMDAAAAERQREQDRRAADVDDRAARLERDSQEFREQLDLAAAEQGRLAHDAARHDARAAGLEALSVTLTERAAKLDAQQATLAVVNAAIERQRDELAHSATAATESERLHAKEAELDRRTGELAGQTATLQAKAEQLAALQERLDADRQAVAARAAALAEADAARQAFQEQLRRRAEELAARGKSLDETGHRLVAERGELDAARATLVAEREQLSGLVASNSGEVGVLAADLAAREANLERQTGRLREVGKLVAAQKRELAGERQIWLAERTEFEASHARATAEMQALQRESPALHDRARQALDRLTSARDVLRGHLSELHAYAGQSRDELRAEALKLDDREQTLEKARGEHRLAVTEFRQQLLEWQAKLAEARGHVARGESAAEARYTEVAAEARRVDESTLALARQAEALRAEREAVSARRGEVEVHLNDLREWYRRKLKELVAGRAAEAGDGATILTPPSRDPHDDPEPGDRQLGERLRALDLVDGDTLTTLWGEARRQRRTLRTVLLAGGAVTLYQLAMMEAGNLGSLMLGRLRVLDRLRVTPREVVYRVIDPERAGGPTRGLFTLRHLAEAEMDDAVRPDEFRQMFTAARDAAHPNLAGTVEVLELSHRPAALLEFVPGLPASDWPAEAATPGAWVRLVLEAARGLDAAHRHGLTHGRISSESFVLTASGEVKVVGVGEPMWLSTGVAAALDPTPEADLRALGQVAYGWSQLGQPGGKRRARGKGFPESLGAVVRRLEADPETPMADTASGAVPYRTAADLVHDLTRLAAIFPCPPEAHAALVEAVAESLGPVRQSA